MARFFKSLTGQHVDFIRRQKMFFTATAPLTPDGHVNLSPKGGDTFRILSNSKAGYLDYTGSGNETSAHLLENGRITIMFCAYDGPPNILRLYGMGRAILPGSADWDTYAGLFPTGTGTRQIILVDIYEVQTSCGYSVPLYQYTGERTQMQEWAEHKGEDGLETYRQEKNRISIDGLPTALF